MYSSDDTFYQCLDVTVINVVTPTPTPSAAAAIAPSQSTLLIGALFSVAALVAGLVPALV